MNDKPEVPGSGGERARSEGDASAMPLDGTPTVNIGGSYGSSDAPYSTSPMPGSTPETPGGAGGYGGQGQTTQFTQPPQYNPSQYGQGQPTQYAPPPGNYPQPYQPQQQYPPQPYNPQYPQPQYPPPYGYVQPKDPTVGLLLELLGYVGFLGIGHIWAGKTTRGVMLLIGYWFYWLCAGILMIVLIGCLMLPIGLAFPLISGFMLKSEMEREQASMGIRRY